MMPVDDAALLQEYARTGAEAAFVELVQRHVALVYSAARRQVGDPHHAEDVTQAVFIVLARKAGQMAQHSCLSGWLLQTTRYAANAHIRAAVRRAHREQDAAMQAEPVDSSPAVWAQLEPHLDEALATLGVTDRAVLVMRYFENRTASEIGQALKLNEEAAKKRTNRALEKLRKFFGKKGIALTAAAIAAAVSTNSVQAAPAGLVAKISAGAMAKGLMAGMSTFAVVKGTLKTLGWVKYKSFITAGAITVVTTGVLMTVVMREHPHETKSTISKPTEAIREIMTDAAYISLDSPPGGLSMQTDGKIIVGTSLFGRFMDVKSGNLGYFERGSVRLNADGSLDRSFLCSVRFPGSDSARAHVDSLSDGKIFLAGLFDSVEGQPCPGYARLLPDGRMDETFNPISATSNSNAPALGRTYLPGGTYPAAALNDGTVAVMTANPLTVYRLDATGKLVPTATNASSLFPPHAGLVFTLKNEGFWGNWFGQQPIDWNRITPATRRPMVRPNGQLPFEDCAEQPSATDAAEVFKALFAEVPLELCRVATRLPGGGAVLAVQDKFINGSLIAPGHLMRFNPDWRPDFSFTNRYEFDRRGSMTIRRLEDGKFLVAGGFVKMNGEGFPGLIRLNQNGEIDRGFHCEIGGPNYGRLVMDVVVQADGKIIICGAFTTVNGQKRQHLARLNPDGSLDDSFKSPFISMEELQAHRRFPVYHLVAAIPASTATNAIALAATGPAETIVITSIDYKNGVAIIQFMGVPQKSYILQAKNSLDASDWLNINTNQTTLSGSGMFRDADAGQHPTRFYRVASQ